VAKPTSLTPDALIVSSAPPTSAPTSRGSRTVKPAKPTNDTPMQIRLPKSEARAIKIAAAQLDKSISEFMLNCFHAYMQNNHLND
jgi:hypothetical protein